MTSPGELPEHALCLEQSDCGAFQRAKQASRRQAQVRFPESLSHSKISEFHCIDCPNWKRQLPNTFVSSARSVDPWTRPFLRLFFSSTFSETRNTTSLFSEDFVNTSAEIRNTDIWSKSDQAFWRARTHLPSRLQWPYQQARVRQLYWSSPIGLCPLFDHHSTPAFLVILSTVISKAFDCLHFTVLSLLSTIIFLCPSAPNWPSDPLPDCVPWRYEKELAIFFFPQLVQSSLNQSHFSPGTSAPHGTFRWCTCQPPHCHRRAVRSGLLRVYGWYFQWVQDSLECSIPSFCPSPFLPVNSKEFQTIKCESGEFRLVSECTSVLSLFQPIFLTGPIRGNLVPTFTPIVPSPFMFHLAWLYGSSLMPLHGLPQLRTSPSEHLFLGVDHCIRSIVTHPSHGSPYDFGNHFIQKGKIHLYPNFRTVIQPRVWYSTHVSSFSSQVCKIIDRNVGPNDPEVVVDHVSDLSSAKHPILFLSFCSSRLTFFLKQEFWMIFFRADAILASSISKNLEVTITLSWARWFQVFHRIDHLHFFDPSLCLRGWIGTSTYLGVELNLSSNTKNVEGVDILSNWSSEIWSLCWSAM